MFDVAVQFDVTRAVARQEALIRKGQVALDVQVLKDSNFFCPFAEGTLQSSGLLYTNPGSGIVEWNTPYARFQYYDAPHKSLDKNPNARMKWFESAKALHRSEWIELARKESGHA